MLQGGEGGWEVKLTEGGPSEFCVSGPLGPHLLGGAESPQSPQACLFGARERQRREGTGLLWGMAAPLCWEGSPLSFPLCEPPGRPPSVSVGPGAPPVFVPSPSSLPRLLLTSEMLVTCSSVRPPLSGVFLGTLPVLT